MPQQPLFSVRIKVMESITNILKKTARLELDNEKNDNYVLKPPVAEGEEDDEGEEEEDEEDEDEDEEEVGAQKNNPDTDQFPDVDSLGFDEWWGQQAKRNAGKKKKKNKKKKMMMMMKNKKNLPPACVSNVSPLITPLDKHLPLRSAAGNAGGVAGGVVGVVVVGVVVAGVVGVVAAVVAAVVALLFVDLVCCCSWPPLQARRINALASTCWKPVA